MDDFVAHLTRQRAFSKATWGPGPRTRGVINHILEELDEVAAVYENAEAPPPGHTQAAMDRRTHAAAADEWTDVVILALDGLLRACAAAEPALPSSGVAMRAVERIRKKQDENEGRNWPDWRTKSQDEAIGHVEGKPVSEGSS